MSIEAKVILDSISPDNIRLTAIQARLPKVLLAELNTHRAISKNTNSSRAIPNKTFVKKDSFQPLYWGKNQPGMQAMREEIENIEEAEKIWNDCIQYCREASEKLTALGLHKQWANRPNDWHIYCDTLLSATDWKNFFNLRIDPGVQPEMEELAKQIKKALDDSEPNPLDYGEWHLPFIDLAKDMPLIEDYDKSRWLVDKKVYDEKILDYLKQISVARCARISYAAFDGDGSISRELDRFHNLVTSKPVHASPLEHIATPFDIHFTPYPRDANFFGWRQYRSEIPGNVVRG